MSKEVLKRLDLNYLAELLRNNEDEDRADEILQEYSKKHMADSDDLEDILASTWNCNKCSSCGRFLVKMKCLKKLKMNVFFVSNKKCFIRKTTKEICNKGKL